MSVNNLNHQYTKKYTYNRKDTPDGQKLFKRQVVKHNGGWKYVGDWILVESMIPRKRKVPSPVGRDCSGRLKLPSDEIQVLLQNDIEYYQNSFDDAETGIEKGKTLSWLNKAKEKLETYNSLCDYIGNITKVIDEIEDGFPKNLLVKHRENISKKKNQFLKIHLIDNVNI